MDSDTQQQPGLITSKLGSFTENLPEDITPESSVLETTDWFSTFKTAARAIGTANATLGTVDEYGRQTSAPEPDVDAKTLQEKYPQLPGQPAFDKPMPDSVASSIYEHQQDENRIADAKARRPAGFWHGAATIGTQFVADALDPLNIASMFVPVIGEGAFVAEGAGLAARIAGRAVTGAVNADIAQTPLIALKYGQSKLENDDYGAWNAMADIATGAAMGAVFHAGISGPLGDYLTRRMAGSPVQTALEADPALRQSALNTSIAQAATDAEVEVRPVFDAAGLHAATEARDNLLNDADAVENIVPGSPAALRIQAIDEELGGSQRLAAIDAELGGVIPAARRESLEAERAMVEHGEQLPSLEHLKALHQEREHIIDLETARAEAQRSGLMEAAGKSEAEISSHLEAKKAEDYAALEAMAKEDGGSVEAAYHATASIGDASLEDMKLAYQHARASDAASTRAAGGERPAVPGSNAPEGAGVPGQVGGVPEPAAPGGGAGAEVAGPAGGAGAAAGAGASAAERSGPVRQAIDTFLKNKKGSLIAYRGTALAEGDARELHDPNLHGGIFFTTDRAYAEQMAARNARSFGGTPRVDAYRVDLENPHMGGRSIQGVKEIEDEAGNAIHDGIVSNLGKGKDEIIAFDPKSITKIEEPVAGAAERASPITPSQIQKRDGVGYNEAVRRAQSENADLALRQNTAADSAQRAADGQPSAAAQAVTREAEAATKVAPAEIAKQAQQEIEDHMQFFKSAEAAGALTEEDRAALQSLASIDEEAKARTEACLQAGACIARGLA